MCSKELELYSDDLEKCINLCEQYLNSCDLGHFFPDDFEFAFKEGVLRVNRFKKDFDKGRYSSANDDIEKSLKLFELVSKHSDDSNMVNSANSHLKKLNFVVCQIDLLNLEERTNYSPDEFDVSDDNLVDLDYAKSFLEQGDFDGAIKLINKASKKEPFEFNSKYHQLQNIVLARSLYHKYVGKKNELKKEGSIIKLVALQEDNNFKYGTNLDYGAYLLLAKYIVEGKEKSSLSWVNLDSKKLTTLVNKPVNWNIDSSSESIDAIKLMVSSYLSIIKDLPSKKNNLKQKIKMTQDLKFTFETIRQFLNGYFLNTEDINDSDKLNLCDYLFDFQSKSLASPHFNELHLDHDTKLYLGRLLLENTETNSNYYNHSMKLYQSYFVGTKNKEKGFKFKNSDLNQENFLNMLYEHGDVERYLRFEFSNKKEGKELDQSSQFLLDYGIKKGYQDIIRLKEEYLGKENILINFLNNLIS